MSVQAPKTGADPNEGRQAALGRDEGRQAALERDSFGKPAPEGGSTRTASLVARGQRYLVGNYRQPALVLARGRGCELFDTDGRRYLDMYAGVAVCSLGHAHPRLARTIAE